MISFRACLSIDTIGCVERADLVNRYLEALNATNSDVQKALEMSLFTLKARVFCYERWLKGSHLADTNDRTVLQ